MSAEITVLLVDDHSLVRKGFRRILEDDPTIEVVGEACDGTEAVRLAQQFHPRVIVMDMAMPGRQHLQNFKAAFMVRLTVPLQEVAAHER